MQDTLLGGMLNVCACAVSSLVVICTQLCCEFVLPGYSAVEQVWCCSAGGFASIIRVSSTFLDMAFLVKVRLHDVTWPVLLQCRHTMHVDDASALSMYFDCASPFHKASMIGHQCTPAAQPQSVLCQD